MGLWVWFMGLKINTRDPTHTWMSLNKLELTSRQVGDIISSCPQFVGKKYSEFYNLPHIHRKINHKILIHIKQASYKINILKQIPRS